MFTQVSDIAVPINGQQELVLQLRREDLEPCSLGTVGNLQFNAEQGGTAPAPRVGGILSEMNQSLVDRRADMNADLACEASQARAQREALTEARAEVRANSLLIGNLLGSLTAKVDKEGRFVDAHDRSRSARALTELNESGAEGGLYSLKGAKYCLHTYLEELTEYDLVALTGGVLSNENACEAVLDGVSTRPDDALRMQASRLLKEVAKAVSQQTARHAMHEPLLRIVDLLAADSVNKQELGAQLSMLSDDRNTQKLYFRTLSTDEFKGLLGTLHSKNLNAVRQALWQTGDYRQANSLIGLVHSLELEFSRRASRSLRNEQVNLTLALGAGSVLAVTDVLCRLSRVVEDTYQTWGALPKSEVERVQRLVESSVDLLRDHQNNPVGPLNGHSLRKLDDGRRKSLGAAAAVLGGFGLELEPELRVC